MLIPGGIASSSKTKDQGSDFKDRNFVCCRLKHFLMMIQHDTPQGSNVTSYFKARARDMKMDPCITANVLSPMPLLSKGLSIKIVANYCCERLEVFTAELPLTVTLLLAAMCLALYKKMQCTYTS